MGPLRADSAIPAETGRVLKKCSETLMSEAGMKELTQLLEQWQEEARSLRERYALESAARICEAHARELAQAIKDAQDEVLTVSEAAKATGYSEQHLRALIASGDIRNAGEKGRPRIRRADLPPRKRGLSGKGQSNHGRKPSLKPNRKGFDARRIVHN